MLTTKQKKGQISIFVIVGILLLLIISFLMFNSNKGIDELNTEDTVNLQGTQKSFLILIDSCLTDTANQGIQDFGLYSGVSDILIKEYMIENLPICIDNGNNFESTGFSLEKGDINVTIQITKDEFIVDLIYPIKLIKDDYLVSFKEKTYNIPIVIWTKIDNNKETTIMSPNKNFRINIPSDTRLLDGKDAIGIELRDREFNGLSNRIVMGMLVYEGLPNGAEFTDPVELIMFYDDKDIPNTVDEKTLQIGYYDEISKIWYALPTDVDVNENKLIAETNHFTSFAILIRCSENEEVNEVYIPISVDECCEQKVEIEFAELGNSCIWKDIEPKREPIIKVKEGENDIDADLTIDPICPEGEECNVRDIFFLDSKLNYIYESTNAKSEISDNQGTILNFIGYGLQTGNSYYKCNEGDVDKEVPIFGGDPLDAIMSECICEDVDENKICKWVAKEGFEVIEGSTINMIRREEVKTYNMDGSDQCDNYEEKYEGVVFKTDKKLDTRTRSFEDNFGDYPEMQFKSWLSYNSETELIIFGSAVVDDVCWLLVEAQDEVTKDGTTWKVDFWIKRDEIENNDFDEIEIDDDADDVSIDDGTDDTTDDDTEVETTSKICTYCDNNIWLYNEMFPDNDCNDICCTGACPDNTVLLDVPYHSQCDYNNDEICSMGCGPTVTTMALEYVGLSNQIKSMGELFSEYKDNGYAIYTMYQYSCGLGACTQTGMTVNNNDLDSLKNEIDNNHPVIITTLINGYSDEACHNFDVGSGHFILLIGYSDEYMIVHDPNPENTCQKSEYGQNLVLTNNAFLNAMSSSSGYIGPLKNPNT
jgi:hypothetical protein